MPSEIIVTQADLANAPSTRTTNASLRALRPFQIDTSKDFTPHPDTVMDVNGRPTTSGIIGLERDSSGNITKVHFVNPKDSADKYAKQSYPVKDGVLILPGQNEAQVAQINTAVDRVVGNKSTVTLADFDRVLKAAHKLYITQGAVPDIYNSDISQLDPAKHIKLGQNAYQKVARAENMYVIEAPARQTVGFQGSIAKDGHLASAQYSSGSFVVITGTDPKTNEPYARKLDLEYAQQNLRDAATGKPIDFRVVPRISIDDIVTQRGKPMMQAVKIGAEADLHESQTAERAKANTQMANPKAPLSSKISITPGMAGTAMGAATLAPVALKISYDVAHGNFIPAADKGIRTANGMMAGAICAKTVAEIASPLLAGGPLAGAAYAVGILGAGAACALGADKLGTALSEMVGGTHVNPGSTPPAPVTKKSKGQSPTGG